MLFICRECGKECGLINDNPPERCSLCGVDFFWEEDCDGCEYQSECEEDPMGKINDDTVIIGRII